MIERKDLRIRLDNPTTNPAYPDYRDATEADLAELGYVDLSGVDLDELRNAAGQLAMGGSFPEVMSQLEEAMDGIGRPMDGETA